MFKNAERQTSKDRIAKEFPEQITVIELVFIYSKELLKPKKEKKIFLTRSIHCHLVYCSFIIELSHFDYYYIPMCKSLTGEYVTDRKTNII